MSLQKMANGKWRAFVGSGKTRKSKVFDKKAMAQDWLDIMVAIDRADGRSPTS